jgi:hypothetical protein
LSAGWLESGIAIAGSGHYVTDAGRAALKEAQRTRVDEDGASRRGDDVSHCNGCQDFELCEGLKTLREQVAEFHAAMNQKDPTTPTVPPDERVRLRAALIAEEFFEMLEAMFPKSELIDEARDAIEHVISKSPISVNMRELADGLADLFYVEEGTYLEFGIDSGPSRPRCTGQIWPNSWASLSGRRTASASSRRAGRPRKLSRPEKLRWARELFDGNDALTVRDVHRITGLHQDDLGPIMLASFDASVIKDKVDRLARKDE